MEEDDVLAHLSKIEREWVTDKQSLTKKLRALTHNQIQLQLLYDNWGIASDAAHTILNIPANEKTWIRKIEWCFKNQCWLSCEVIIPTSSLTKDTHELTQIGHGAIGEVLFKDPTLKRSDFTYQKESNGLTRYSIFCYKTRPLLIIETFQADFFAVLRYELNSSF